MDFEELENNTQTPRKIEREEPLFNNDPDIFSPDEFETDALNDEPSFGEKLGFLWKEYWLLIAAILLGIAAIGAVVALVRAKDHASRPEPPAATPTVIVEPEWEEPAEDAEYDASAGVIDSEAFVGTVLPETEDAGAEYIAGTLFLGDSNTYRYMMYADPDTGEAFTSTANNIGVVSMGAGAISTLRCEEFVGDSKSYTMPEAAAKLKPQRIILGFGTNNLYGNSTHASGFIASYEKGIKAVETAWPYADILITSIPPLDKQRSNTALFQSQIDAYNLAIVEMCEANGWHYLNTAEALKDPATGWAKKDYTLSDGVHLNKEAVTALFRYIRTHAYLAADRRPKPLGAVPTPTGVIPGLITEDPIAIRGQSSDKDKDNTDSKPSYPLELNTVGEGTASLSASKAKIGDSVTLTAKASVGWLFEGWSCSTGRISNTDSLSTSLTVTSDVDANGVLVTANFVKCQDHKWVDPAKNEDEALAKVITDKTKYICKKCHLVGDSTKPAEHTHDFSVAKPAESDKAPTCGADGKATYGCSVKGCTEVSVKTIPATGNHSWGEGVLSEDQTQKVYTCTVCGQTKQESYAPTPTPEATPTPTPEATPTPTPEATPPSDPTPTPESPGGEGSDGPAPTSEGSEQS